MILAALRGVTVFFGLIFNSRVERKRDVVERMERGMNLILRDAQDDDTILVVGHNRNMTLYIRKILDEERFTGFRNASFVKLVGDGQAMQYAESKWPAENVRLNLDEES